VEDGAHLLAPPPHLRHADGVRQQNGPSPALSLFFVFVLLPKLKAKTITHGGYTGKTAKQLLQTAPCFCFNFLASIVSFVNFTQ